MMKTAFLNRVIQVVLLAGMLAASGAATTVTLTNGKTFTGEVVSETTAALVLSINGSPVSIFKSIISKREDSPSSSAASPSAAAPVPAPAPAQAAKDTAPPAVTPVPQAAAEKTPVQKQKAPVVSPGAAPDAPGAPHAAGRNSLAVNFSTSIAPHYNWNYITKRGTSNNRSEMYLLLSLGIQPGKLVEYRPSLGVNRISSGYVASDSTGDIPSTKSTYSSWGLLGDFGIYFHAVDNEHFGFSLGPDLFLGSYFAPAEKLDTAKTEYKSYYNLIGSFGVPLDFDIKLGRSFALRMTMNLASFDVGVVYQKEKNNAFDKSALNFDFNVATQWVPAIGCVFMF